MIKTKSSKKTFTIQSLSPVNTDEEREKFFFDSNYNPQFVYERTIPEEYLLQYAHFSEEYLTQAKNILDAVIKKWGKESSFLEEAEGRLLTKEEISAQIFIYLKQNELDKLVTIHFTNRLVSRTLIDGFSMYIRLPIEYREKSFLGVLDHELGTHVLRRVNDRKQPWFGQRQVYKLRPCLETEEGIASLHSHLGMKEKFIWMKALLYYAVCLAKSMTFSELNLALKSYIESKERRWNVCLRVKRGLSDTSIPGMFAKDQIYLRGMIRVIQWLEKHQYDLTPLYFGKVDLEDVKKAQTISPNFQPVLPKFFTNDSEAYKQHILEIKKTNFL